MDINAFSSAPLVPGDSNPGRIEYAAGGVGRNIAENLHRLGVETRFIGVIGDDPGGDFIKSSSARIGLNIEHSLFLKAKGAVTSAYLAMVDSNGELKLALSDMGIMEQMTVEHIEAKAAIIAKSAIVLLDTNLSEKIIRFILNRFSPGSGSGPPPLFFLDGVSAKKALAAASCLGCFHTVKLGVLEASALSGIELSEEPALAAQGELLKKAAKALLATGLHRLFITLGKEGVYTARKDRQFLSPVRPLEPVNTSGAGDAFMAGTVYGTLQGWEDERIVSFASAMAGITVESRSAVSPRMSLALVEERMTAPWR